MAIDNILISWGFHILQREPAEQPTAESLVDFFPLTHGLKDEFKPLQKISREDRLLVKK